MKAPPNASQRGRPVRANPALPHVADEPSVHLANPFAIGRNAARLGAIYLFFLLSLPSFAQGPLLTKEAFSREYSVHVGGEQTPLVKDIASREVSLFIGAEPTRPYVQAISREMSIVVTTLAAPERVTQLNATPSPTGERATLEWCGYNELAQSDVVRYRIYVSTTAFTTVSNLTPLLIVPAGTCSITLSNLPAFQDRYYAVVAEDALGGSDPSVDYSAAYVLAPQAISREYSLFVGGEPSPPYAQALSREVSLLISTPEPPQRITQLNVTPSPTGDRATLEWCGYNELLQRDVVRYDIFLSTSVFTSVSNLTRFATVPAGTCSITISNLTAFQDRYFAGVAVDATGAFDPVVDYSAAYVLAPQAISREFSIFVGGEPASPYAQAISREMSILVPENTVPDPVTGLGSGFDAVTSSNAFSAIDANWSTYNELKQRDVVRYRVYLGPSFYTDVSSMTPYEFIPAGTQRHTIRGLFGGDIYYVAVVAEDLLGNWNPVVRSVSAKASISQLGDPRNLVVTSSSNALHFTWDPPEQVDAFLNYYNVYFGASATRVQLTNTITRFDPTNLQPATAYPFRVTTVDIFRNESGGLSVPAATWLPHPTNVAAQSFDGMARLTWTHAEPNDLVKHYAVYRSTSPFSSVSGLTPVLTTRATRADVTGLANGTLNYFAVTTVNMIDGENPSVPTVTTTPNPVPGTFADLLLTNVVSPASVYQGQTITMNWLVRNVGAGGTSTRSGTSVNSWTDRVVLSPDAVFGDADDIVLADVPHAGALSAGGTYPGSATVQIPTNLLGFYYVFVLANAGGQVYEHLDAAVNLSAALPMYIGPPAPPIITQQPLDVNTFEGHTISFNVVAEGSPPLIYQWRRGAANLPGRTNATLTLSNVLVSDSGSYSVVIANVAGSTNSRAATLTVNPPPPDLFALNLQSPTNIIAGQPVAVSWMTTNGGVSIAAPPWQERLLLANNAAGTNATALFSLSAPSPLTASNAVTRTPTVIFPTTLSGNYWLVVQVDSADQVAEDYGETNNILVATQPVVITAPDLVAVEVSLRDAGGTVLNAATFGQTFTAKWSVRNAGTGPTFANWTDRIFLSTSAGSISGATQIGSVAANGGSLAPGASYTNNASVRLPLGSQYPPGIYHLVVVADGDNAQPEANEANNLASRALSLTLPPLPDLVAANVSSLTNASPGQTIPVTWNVTNQGPATATGPWTETIRIVADEVTRLTNSAEVQSLLTSAATLGTFAYSNTLAPGAFLARTQFVTLPVSGVSGDTRLVVTVDARDEVFEENETNNVALGTNVLRVPLSLTLQLSSAQISEDATVPLRATLTRNGSLAQALTVTVSNSHPGELSFVQSLLASAATNITISAGQSVVVFNLYAVADHIVDANQLVTIGASAPGYDSASASVTVLNFDLPTLTLTAATNAVTEGFTVAMTVTRDVVTSNALTVALSSSSPSQLSPPGFITIPPGVASANFSVLAVDDANAEAANTYSISASAAGFNSGLASVTVLDNDVPQLTVSLSTHTVSEGAGAQALSMTVTRSPVGAGALSIEPEAGDPSLVVTPIRITIPPGQASRSFPVGVIDDTLVNGSRMVALGAYALAAGSGARLSSAAPEVLTVTDDDGPTLKLVAALKLVREGLNPATIVMVTRNTPATNDLLVSLSTSRTNEATVPASVTIPNGAVSATFALTSVADGTNDGNQTVTLTATASNFTPGTETVVVSDTDLPDLVVASITAPASAVPQQRVSIGYRLANQGLSATAGGFLTRVYLSRDAVVGGDDVLVAQFRNTNAIAVGQLIESTEQIDLPLAVGNYWVVVETDAEQTLAEVLEDNNTRISATPIAVAADYAAWVRTDVTSTNANTPVPLYGRATNSLGAGTASRPVSIHILVRGTQRILSATTDANGNFTTTFTPLPGEAGRYDIFATHPGVGTVAVQDTFDLLGFRANPSSVSLTVVESLSRSGNVSLENLSDVPLTGLTVQVVSKPANLTVAADVSPRTLPGSGTLPLNYTFTATTADAYGTVQLRVTTAEGLTQDIYFGVSVEPLRPRLVATPVSLYAAMPVGGQAVVEFNVANLGGRDSGPITVSLPAVPWMHLASTNPMSSLAPGQTNRVTLLLTPARDLPLTLHSGNIALNGQGSPLALPFGFRAMSLCVGDLRVDAVDEFTYYADGAPHVAGATVVIRDSLAQTNVATGVTDTNGQFFVAGLPEGYYDIEVSADRHTQYRATHLLRAGVTNDVQPFLSRQTVTYTWTVEPIQLEDRYRITIETVFETVVPIPVVIVEPSVIDLSEVVGDEATVNLKITNKGLIAANTARLQFPTHPSWEIKPFIEDLGNIPANTSYTVPVTIRRLGARGGGSASGQVQGVSPAAAQPRGSCSIAATVCWDLLCGGRTNRYSSTIGIVNAEEDCVSVGLGGGFVPVGGVSGPGNGSPGSPFVTVVAFAPPTVCDCSFLGIPLAGHCLGGGIGLDFDALLEQLVSKILSKLPGLRVEEAKLSLSLSGEICSCCKSNELGWEGNAEAKAAISITLAGGLTLPPIPDWAASGWSNITVTADGLLGVRGKLSGEVSGKLTRLCGGGKMLCFAGSVGVEAFAGADFHGEATAAFSGVSFTGEVEGEAGLKGSLSVSVQGCLGEDPVFEFCGNLSSRLNASGKLSAMVGGEEIKKTFSADLNVPLWDTGCQSGGEGGGAFALAAVAGPPIREPFDANKIVRSDSEILSALGVSTPQGAGICAHVKLRLEQEAVITRDAFRATLELDNNGPSRLENVRVALDIRDESGRMVTNQFAERFEGVTVLSAVDGHGILAGNSTGTAKWTLIPTVDAAPQVVTRFLVGGTLSYRLDGNDVTVDMTPVPITVLPSPRLTLQYFHQRDVFSDDPFTDIIEPAIPYSLAVMVQNRGYGQAKNFRITSALPKIIENDKGLLIDFNIIATEVFKAGTNYGLTPSLTANFGDINAGDTAISRWLLTSTLQGLFIDYSARFEHIDGLGNSRLSLIDEVSIHEMIHLVQASGIWEDGKPDFLVNEVPDIHDYPDTLYQSNGSTNPVLMVEQATPSGVPSPGNTQIILTAPMPGGWAYLRVPDPGNGQFRLTCVTRSDGTNIALSTNVWTTDRTFIGLSKRPIRENILHLLDYNSSGSYTLTYEPGSLIIEDPLPPISSVTNLPAASRPYFQVNWSGRDEGLPGQPLAGIAYYDIYVSENGGSFTNWLPRTTLVSATYVGTNGSHYAFYSVATDANGNRESAPATPDAETTVSITNSPPSITIPNMVMIIEGETLDLAFIVADPDTNQFLTVTLLNGAPPGVQLNAAERRLSWPTGEGNGPSTNTLTVVVRDNDFESLSATGRVTVVVNEVNSPPAMEVIPSFTINEKRALTHTVRASDLDLPAQALTFSLGAGAPAGASIGATSGVFAWNPSEIQGGTTNSIAVIVRDTGTPPLGATQTFTVIVRDTSPDFDLSLGSTNVLAGQSSAVSLRVRSGQDLTNLTLKLTTPVSGLTGLTLQPVASEVANAVLSPDGTNGSLLRLSAAGGQVFHGDLSLARLVFDAVPAVHSSVVPLLVSELRGVLADGAVLPNGRGTGGRVFVIGQEPLLDAMLATNGGRSLVLYGHPGEAYEIQSSTNLNQPPVWQPAHGMELITTFDTWIDLPVANSQVYYRAVQLSSPSVNRIAGLTRLPDGRLQFQFPGIAGRTYVIEASTNLLSWQTIGTNTAPVSFTTPAGATSPYRFFRLKTQP